MTRGKLGDVPGDKLLDSMAMSQTSGIVDPSHVQVSLDDNTGIVDPNHVKVAIDAAEDDGDSEGGDPSTFHPHSRPESMF